MASIVAEYKIKKKMREIKFAFWHKQKKEMWSVQSIDWDQKEVSNGGDVASLDSGVLLQYTGLKDKNSKEIYEDDIVKSGEFIYGIIFKEGCFGFENINPINKISMNFANLSKELAQIIEVVGNVYENPELIEKNKK